MRRSIRTTLAAVALTTAGLAGNVSVAAAGPTVKPTVKRTYVHIFAPKCAKGYLCAYVRTSPTSRRYYRFSFKHCKTRYRLSDWRGRGFIVNNQVGGVTARFYTRSGARYTTRRTVGTSQINWGPVWSLRVC